MQHFINERFVFNSAIICTVCAIISVCFFVHENMRLYQKEQELLCLRNHYLSVIEMVSEEKKKDI